MTVIVVNPSISPRYSIIKLPQASIGKDFMQIDLYLPVNIANLCIKDTPAGVNVMPVSVYKKLSYNYNFSKMGLTRVKFRVYNSTVMNVIG